MYSRWVSCSCWLTLDCCCGCALSGFSKGFSFAWSWIPPCVELYGYQWGLILCTQLSVCVRVGCADLSPLSTFPALCFEVPSLRRCSPEQRMSGHWASGNDFLLWGWLTTGCSEKLWNLHPWRCAKPNRTWSWATSSRLPCSSRNGTRCSQRSLSTSATLCKVYRACMRQVVSLSVKDIETWGGKKELWFSSILAAADSKGGAYPASFSRCWPCREFLIHLSVVTGLQYENSTNEW